ncbi:MAG: flagellar hook-length control protein FliK [Gammaproteobacteria bacterium]
MGVENLNLAFLQSPVSPGSKGFLALLPGSVEGSGTTNFLEQLAEQLRAIQDSEHSHADPETLYAGVIQAANPLPDGNFLPYPEIEGRQSFSAHQAADLDFSSGAPVRSQLVFDSGSAQELIRSKTGLLGISAGAPYGKTGVAVPPIPIGSQTIRSGENDPETSIASASLSPGTYLTNIEPANALSTEREQPVPKETAKILLGDLTTPRGEGLNLHSPISERSDAGKTAILSLEKPLEDRAWQHDFTDRITWMAKNSMAGAELKINPPQLGPVEVRIQIDKEHMNVYFASHDASVREAIEAALPRLRESLGTQQLTLTNVDISNSFNEQPKHQPGGDNGGHPRGEGFAGFLFGPEEDGLETFDAGSEPRNQGLLNYFV